MSPSGETCGVCGRTMLKGERTRVYLTAGGEERNVCELCGSRAEALGWLSEEAAREQIGRPAPARRRRGPLGALLSGRSRGAHQTAKGGEDVDEPVAEPKPRRNPDPAAAGARVGRTKGAGQPLSRQERAVASFNTSEHARTVAGLIRSLGQPSVSVGNGAGAPGLVRITVAWELSWYQWGVNPGEEEPSIYEIGKGHEIAELDGSARQWNAHATESGQLRLGRAPGAAQSEPAAAEH